MKRSWHEDFALFFETPTRKNLREMLKNHTGESFELDFKEGWIENSKLAHEILGFANTGGGCIVVGVKQRDDKSLESIGLESFIDKTDIQNGVQHYIPSQLQYEILDFVYEASEYPKLVGKKFQVVLIDNLPQYMLFICMKQGDKIRRGAIYIRRGTKVEEINYEELQALLNRRIETQYSNQDELELKKEFEELKFLYSLIEKNLRISKLILPAYTFARAVVDERQNPKYPDEDFEDFVAKMIDVKKKRIVKIIRGI